MKTLKIDKRRDVLIVEKSKGSTIKKGSKIFCGCCGKSIGEVKKDLTFPFKHDELFKSMKKRTLKKAPLTGFRHDDCGHTMFSFRDTLGFMSLENYVKNTVA